MNTEESKLKLNIMTVIDALRTGVNSSAFPFVTAVLSLFCYYLGLDMVIIWYMSLCGMFIMLFSKDTSPLITLFLFMNIMISMKNTPTLAGSNDPSNYYFQPHILAQIGVAIGLFGGAGLLRLAYSIRKGQFRCTPTFFGLCLFAVCILFNGVFSEGYTPMNAVYGFFMAFLFLVVFCICSGSINVDRRTFERIAWAFIALSICLVIELVVAYITYDNVLEEVLNGHRADNLYFGWGIHNTMGMLLTISMPSVAFLACRLKKGFLLTVWLVVLEGAVFLSMSRQAMLFGTLIFVICAIYLLVKSKYRWVNLGIFGAAALAVIIFLICHSSLIIDLWNVLTEDFFSGSGRTNMYKQAWDVYSQYPLFGNGFYNDLSGDPGFVGLPLVPDMYHNTIFQLLAAGGMVAFIPYVIHRMHTVISFIKNPSECRFFIGLTILALLLLSLLDNHIFYILPTLVYSFMTAVLVNSEDYEKPRGLAL